MAAPINFNRIGFVHKIALNQRYSCNEIVRQFSGSGGPIKPGSIVILLNVSDLYLTNCKLAHYAFYFITGIPKEIRLGIYFRLSDLRH